MAKASNAKSLRNAKNLARGALASLKENVHLLKRRGDAPPVERMSSWNTRQVAVHRLNEALSKARSGLNKADLERFNEWLSELQPALDVQSNSVGTPLAALGILPAELTASNLNRELVAAIERLEDQEQALGTFANTSRGVAEAINQGTFELAARDLEKAKAEFGHSFWYVETNLALTRILAGVDKMKETVAGLSIRASGHQRFLFHYFGVRNEPAQSSARFRSTVKQIIENSKLSQSLKTYLKFRLCTHAEPNSDVLADLLAYEQTTTLIDLFFTVSRVCNLIITQPRLFARTTVETAEFSLASLEKLSSSQNSTPICNLAPHEIKRLVSQTLVFLFEENIDQEDKSAGFQAAKAVASQLSTRGSEFASDEASKAFLNLSWLPVSLSLGEIQDFPTLPELLLDANDTALSSPFLAELRKLITSRCPCGFPDATKSALEILWHINDIREGRSSENLLQFLRKSMDPPDSGVRKDILQVLYAHALYEAGDLESCVKTCADAGCINERLLSQLPLADLFVGKRWTSLRRLGASVELAIALSHACKIIEDEKLRTFKRFATEELLTNHSCMVIDELVPKLAAKADHQVVAYFGYYVCDIPTLELLPGVGESRSVRRIRSAVLRSLAKLNTDRALAFETEAQSIEDALQVDDGLSVLDDSKVHVDEEAIVNYVTSEYQADFQRYKQLVANGIGTSESLTEILKHLETPSARIFQIPKNDADDLLVQLTNNVLQRFLYDPAAGLDIIIGRRIRHNTISSEIRGVLEKDELIGTIHHGRYQAAPAVVRACSNLGAKQRKIVLAASARFSESIDQIVALLRDQYFNVKSRAKPRGVFELNINSVLFTLARSTAQTCNTLEEFTRECIDAFWMFLSFRLEHERPDIESEIRKLLRNAFEKFSAELSAQKSELTLISLILRAAEELQRRAMTIASWIGVPKLRLQANSYPLDKTVDIAIAMVSGQVPGFKPILTQTINTTVELDSRGFAIVSDALYVVIGNIAQHSGKRAGNRMKVLIDFDEARSVLVFDVSCEATSSAQKPDKLARLQSIRSDIQRKAFVDGARKNKHSGLYKLAALVYQSKKTSLSFDFLPTNIFNTRFELEYICLKNVEAI
jgi:hypothetical protein